jgi:hypothetical protein
LSVVDTSFCDLCPLEDAFQLTAYAPGSDGAMVTRLDQHDIASAVVDEWECTDFVPLECSPAADLVLSMNEKNKDNWRDSQQRDCHPQQSVATLPPSSSVNLQSPLDTFNP